MRIVAMCGGPRFTPSDWRSVRYVGWGDWGREYRERGLILDIFQVAIVW